MIFLDARQILVLPLIGVTATFLVLWSDFMTVRNQLRTARWDAMSKSVAATAAPTKPLIKTTTTKAPAPKTAVEVYKLPDEEKYRIISEYKAHFKHEFDPFPRVHSDLLGAGNISLRKFKGDFRFRLKAPSTLTDGSRYFSIFMGGISNASAQFAESILQEDISTEGEAIAIHLSGRAIAPFFIKETDLVAPDHELEELADVILTIRPSKKHEISDISARFSFDPNETPTVIGVFEYTDSSPVSDQS